MTKYAEELNYFDTMVHPAKSQAEIIELLDDFGAKNYVIQQGRANGQYAWLLRFEWQGQAYRFVFTPRGCRYPDKQRSFGGKRRTHQEQAQWQMGRIAVYFAKAILTAAGLNPDALFGFLELPGVASPIHGLPATAAEVNVSGLTKMLPDLALDAEVLYLTEGGTE